MAHFDGGVVNFRCRRVVSSSGHPIEILVLDSSCSSSSTCGPLGSWLEHLAPFSELRCVGCRQADLALKTKKLS